MAEIVLAVVVGLALYWFFILRPGRLDFWKVAAKHPDAAYDHFKSDATWIVFEGALPQGYRAHLPRSEWVGPFMLIVPKLGNQTVRVFGKSDGLERSQNEFLVRVGQPQ